MDVSLFNHKSPRAAKARLGHQLSPWAVTLEISVVLLIIGGLALVGFGFAIGWAVIGIAGVPAMIVEWYKYELREVPFVTNGKRVDDILESEVLALLHDQPSPQDIARVISQTTGGQFFAVRFGLSGGFLEQVVSANRDDTKVIFEEALKISQNTGNKISAGVLILAMIRQLPGKQTLLGHMR